MSPWGWKPERSVGIWRFGTPMLRPLVAVAPWLTVVLLLLLFHLIGGALTSARGVLFELPEAGLSDGEATGLVALVMPVKHETLVFFDDSRYMLGDEASLDALASHMAERMSRTDRKTLLVLADRRVTGGDLMKLAGLVKRGGAEKILFAEKKAGASE